MSRHPHAAIIYGAPIPPQQIEAILKAYNGEDIGDLMLPYQLHGLFDAPSCIGFEIESAIYGPQEFDPYNINTSDITEDELDQLKIFCEAHDLSTDFKFYMLAWYD